MTSPTDAPPANSSSCCWMQEKAAPTSICFGTGRFLRSVLVPLLDRPVLIQTRGRSFYDYTTSFLLNQQRGTAAYPVDTVLSNGDIETETHEIAGVFSMGHDKQSVLTKLVPTLANLQVIGVGVTEAGMSSHTTAAMRDLFELLGAISRIVAADTNNKICVINTDNVMQNGAVLKKHMETLATTTESNSLAAFLNTRVVFLNSMVDRITSHRENDTMVPRAEPLPSKALVLLDEHGDLPAALVQSGREGRGLVIRQLPSQLQADIGLKLRVANGTHTALAHVMALCGLRQTDELNKKSSTILLDYVTSLVHDQILPAAAASTGSSKDALQAVWEDWRGRLTHPHFGLSTFFITQNGAAKGGIRLGPTVMDLLQQQQQQQSPVLLSVTTAFSFAVLLRWLTPAAAKKNDTGSEDDAAINEVYTGWLNGSKRKDVQKDSGDGTTVEYADGLRYNVAAGWYEFKCACETTTEGSSGRNIAAWLDEIQTSQPQQPSAYVSAIRAYLTSPRGGDLAKVAETSGFEPLVQSIATLYARMVAGDDLLEMLHELKHGGFAADTQGLVDAESLWHGRPVHYRPSAIPDTSALMRAPVTVNTAAAVVESEVASALVIDLHTHLLPPSHGALCLWGIDELLSYHYLVAEYFMTAPSATMTPELFYAKTKQEQADLVWEALFVDRTPISEASRGVVTTLLALGLAKELETRNLNAIRIFYRTFRDGGLAGTERFSDMVFRKSGVRYNIMTNIPFDTNEAKHWRPKRKEYPAQYRSALRVDPLLSGDRKTVESALAASGYDTTLEGARQYLRDWCDTMQPEYMMCSTPHDFSLDDKNPKRASGLGVNEEAMKQPGAFAEVVGGIEAGCSGTGEDSPSVIDEESDFLSEVLMVVCQERGLPVALKIGAHRGVNPRLKQAGDGVVAFADAGMLARLCCRFPTIKFLATFLSRNSQHEACVLASKFGNLHIYGCWWYCFTPSIMKEMTSMRLEMLGTAFTAQHSDARVLDQLIYKWSHSRAVIAEVLQEEVQKLCATGWKPTRAELRRDIGRLFGGSYEEFMEKSLI